MLQLGQHTSGHISVLKERILLGVRKQKNVIPHDTGEIVIFAEMCKHMTHKTILHLRKIGLPNDEISDSGEHMIECRIYLS